MNMRLRRLFGIVFALAWAAAMAAYASTGEEDVSKGPLIGNGLLQLGLVRPDGGDIRLTVQGWPGFTLDALSPRLRVNEQDLVCGHFQEVAHGDETAVILEYRFDAVELRLRLERAGEHGLRASFRLSNPGSEPAVLNRVALFETQPGGAGASFGARPEAVRILEQGNYWGRVIPLARVPDAATGSTGEPAGPSAEQAHVSDLFSVAYDRGARMAFLAGFETSERWLGRIEIEPAAWGAGHALRIGFDGGDTRIDPGETVALEDVLFLAGDDPWRLLETYGDLVRARHNPQFPASPPVSWCSWYPYRLGVTEERILETARIAAERLKPLGLSIIEADLGWERQCLPNAFDENERFPHGLAWLASELNKLGFQLGVWKAPFTISEFDPLAKEHPEWLICDESGNPVPYWTWFWEPHGNVFVLDITHPGAQDWLRKQVAGLYARGVRYFKADFIGCVSSECAKRRYNPKIVAGGGTEAGRIGARIIREALPDALVLNCGGPEMPGTGSWPLLYTCNDTGNTGFIQASQQATNYQAVACHLFKNGRWGVIQPSCLCVGLPGTLDDARLRATAAFLAGGQIDISDTLTTLPEDRWEVLCATLPPLGVTARPVDLFEPVCDPTAYDYEATCKGESSAGQALKEHPPGSVWHVRVEGDWDTWDLIGVFSYDGGLSRFQIPFPMLDLNPSEHYWAYEFWSGQFLGQVPGGRKNPGDYAHPGDMQDLVVSDAVGMLDIAFFGPGVKLLCLRTVRPHPWVVGSSFHQSCGAELRQVVWDAASSTLSGELHRPAGEIGFIALADGGGRVLSAEVEGRAVPVRRGANGSLVLAVTVGQQPASWHVTFGD
jgi:hypothetical protein